MTSLFGLTDAARWIAEPGPDDDKYSRGVLGVVAGSPRYPGAAVLTVDAALHTGVGMLRYRGAAEPTQLVLQWHPEAVVAEGRVDAWVVGPGHDAEAIDAETAAIRDQALADGVPTVIDAGALPFAHTARGIRILVPHAGELARLLDTERAEVLAAPADAAREAASRLDAIVLLKGHTTRVASPGGALLEVSGAPAWTATAGAGDALAGILGALVATRARHLAEAPDAAAALAASAAVIHGEAAHRASRGGPFTVLELCAQIPEVVRQLLRS